MINTIPSNDRLTVEQYFAAMQAGSSGVDDLVSLFEDEAVYVEPFTGKPQVHSGKGEIRAFFQEALETHMKGARLILDRLDIDGGRLRSEWTCEIPMFNVCPPPMLKPAIARFFRSA